MDEGVSEIIRFLKRLEMRRSLLLPMLHAMAFVPATIEAASDVIPRKTWSSSVAMGSLLGEDGWGAPQLALEYDQERDAHALGLSASVESVSGQASGRGRIHTRAADGTEEDVLDSRTRNVAARHMLDTRWRQPLAGGHLELAAGLSHDRIDEQFRTDALAEGPAESRINELEEVNEANLTMHWSRENEGASKLVLAVGHHRNRLKANSRFLDGPDERSGRDAKARESKIGIEWARSSEETRTLSFAAYGTHSYLDSHFRLLEDGEAIVLPGAQTRWEEWRANVQAHAGIKSQRGLELGVTLGAQSSRWQHDGDSLRDRGIAYLTPKVELSLDAGGRYRGSLSLERMVEERDYHDFLASATLKTGAISAGNVDLRQSRSWRFAAEWERDIGKEGSFVARWKYDDISDAIDRVVISTNRGDMFDAAGNIGRGYRHTLELTLSAKLTAVGLPNSQVKAAIVSRDSRVTDPLTGKHRGISTEPPLERNLEIKTESELNRLNWGVGLNLAQRSTEYAFDEITVLRAPMSWKLFAEGGLTSKWTLRAQLSDLGGRWFAEDRYKYDGSREWGAQRAREQRSHRASGLVQIVATRSFGG